MDKRRFIPHFDPLQFLGETEPGKVKSENPRDTLDFTLTEGLHTLTHVSMQRKRPVWILYGPQCLAMFGLLALLGMGIYGKTTLTYGA